MIFDFVEKDLIDLPSTPYVKRRQLMFGEMADKRNAMHETTLPTIVTVRHPHRFVKALTIGPLPMMMTIKV